MQVGQAYAPIFVDIPIYIMNILILLRREKKINHRPCYLFIVEICIHVVLVL